MKLWAKINMWCLYRVKNTSQILFCCSFWDSGSIVTIKEHPWLDGWGGWADLLNLSLLHVIPGLHPKLWEMPAAPNHLWNQGFAVNPGSFSFYHSCLICVVFSNEISFGGVPALPGLGEPSLRGVRCSGWAAECGLSLEPSPTTVCLDSKCTSGLGHEVHLTGCVKSSSIGTTLLRSDYVLTLRQGPRDPVFLCNSFQNIIYLHYPSPCQMNGLDTRWAVVNFRAMLWNVLGKIPEEHSKIEIRSSHTEVHSVPLCLPPLSCRYALCMWIYGNGLQSFRHLGNAILSSQFRKEFNILLLCWPLTSVMNSVLPLGRVWTHSFMA